MTFARCALQHCRAKGLKQAWAEASRLIIGAVNPRNSEPAETGGYATIKRAFDENADIAEKPYLDYRRRAAQGVDNPPVGRIFDFNDHGRGPCVLELTEPTLRTC
jgi:hypothetical protein